MSITADTVVVGVRPQDISLDRFRDVLRAANSPAASTAGAAYIALGEIQVSIAFCLAVFHHESTYATNPAAIVVKHGTNNPGNCRTSRSGTYPVIDTARGQFVAYPDWVSGWRDLAFRLIDPAYAYANEGRTTIRQIITRFAPATDGNSPEAYIRAVVADMNRWTIGDAPMAAQIPGFAWVPETAGEYGYPQGTHGRNGVTIDRLIIHCTIGTDSLGHLTGGNGNSVHLLDNRDGTPRAQMVLLEDAAWGAGNRAYNLRGVNYEHECTGAEMRNPAYWTDGIIGNMARNCAAILRHPLCAGILPDREHVIGHGEVPDQDHTDPGPAFPWDRFMAALVGELNGAGDTSIRYFPETGFHVGHGFLAFWSQFGSDATSVAVFGYPLTEEIQEDGRTVQYFERSVFEYWPENPPEYTVLLRRLGADALEAA